MKNILFNILKFINQLYKLKLINLNMFKYKKIKYLIY